MGRCRAGDIDDRGQLPLPRGFLFLLVTACTNRSTCGHRAQNGSSIPCLEVYQDWCRQAVCPCFAAVGPFFLAILCTRDANIERWIRALHRWPSDGALNPYDYEAIASFVRRATGMMAANTSWRGLEASPMVPRGSPTWSGPQIAFSWVLIILACVSRSCRQSSISFLPGFGM